MINTDYMYLALKEAAGSNTDIPVGAVIVKNNEILASTCNKKEEQQNPTRHAEIIAIEKACQKLKTWHLDDCCLYVTLEPCPMCAWAIIQSRIKNVYFGTYDPLYGALGSKLDLRTLLNSKLKVKGGILEKECDNILRTYFETLRNDNKNKIR